MSPEHGEVFNELIDLGGVEWAVLKAMHCFLARS
jgi:hypothetical protein